MKIKCPECTQKLEIDFEPKEIVNLTCPVCKHSFKVPGRQKVIFRESSTSPKTGPLLKSPKKKKGIFPIVYFGTLIIVGFFILTGMIIWKSESSTTNEYQEKKVDPAILKQAMIDVMKKDKAIADSYKGKPKLVTNDDYDKNANNMLSMVREMQNIDLSSCPSEFIDAFENHIRAWAKFQSEYSKHPYIYTRQQLETRALWSGAAGNNPVPQMEAYYKELKSWNANTKLSYSEITPTYNRVERIAIKYGIDVHKIKSDHK